MNQSIGFRKINIVLKDDLFFVSYVFLFLSEMISIHTNLSDLLGNATHTIARILYIAFLVVCGINILLRRKYSHREFTVLIFIVILGILSYYFSGAHEFLDFLLMTFTAKNINFKKFVKRMVIFIILFTLLIILLSGFGAISVMTKERTETGQIRTSLGFSHPNILGLLVFQIIAGTVIVRGEKLKALLACLLLGIGVIFYLFTGSLTSIIAISALILIVFLYNCFIRRTLTSRQIRIVVGIMLVVLAIIMIFVIRYFWLNPNQTLFRTFASRLRLAQKYLNAYGVNLFGHNILTGSNVALPGYSAGYSYLDNGEVWYLVQYGIVGFVVFFGIYINMIRKTWVDQNIIFLIVAIAYLIYSVSENPSLSILFNFMLVYAGMALYEREPFRKRKLTT